MNTLETSIGFSQLCVAEQEASVAERKMRAIRAQWATPILQAVFCASEFCEPEAHTDSSTLWRELGKVIKNDPAAWPHVMTFADAGGKEDKVSLALGFGIICGMMYSALTGITLTPPEESNLP